MRSYHQFEGIRSDLTCCHKYLRDRRHIRRIAAGIADYTHNSIAVLVRAITLLNAFPHRVTSRKEFAGEALVYEYNSLAMQVVVFVQISSADERNCMVFK